MQGKTFIYEPIQTTRKNVSEQRKRADLWSKSDQIKFKD